jgi:serine/threonine protein kinase
MIAMNEVNVNRCIIDRKDKNILIIIVIIVEYIYLYIHVIKKMVRKVGKYELGRTLGEGTFGKVKYAVHSETQEAVAIKVLDKEKIQNALKSYCDKKSGNNEKITQDLKFDFYWNINAITKENLDKLMEYIDMKHYVGHFTWIYIASLFSLLTSIVATVMTPI